MLKNASHLLLLLYRKRDFINAVFESSGRQLHVNSALGLISQNELDELVALDIIDLFHDEVLLNDHIVEFLESFLAEGRDAELYDYRTIFKKIENSITLYYKNRESGNDYERHLRSINSQLRKMPRNLRDALESIQYRVEFVYKGVLSVEQKRDELAAHRESLDQIDDVMTYIKTELKKHTHFFAQVIDSSIIHQHYRLNEYILTAYNTLIGTIDTVFNYIRKVEANIRFYEHIVMLKELRDRKEINDKTNLFELLSQTRGILASGFDRVEKKNTLIMLNPDYPYEDDFVTYVKKTRSSIGTEQVNHDTTVPLDDYFLADEVEPIVNYSGILYDYIDNPSGTKNFFEYLTEKEPELGGDALLDAYMSAVIANEEELEFHENIYERIGIYDCIRVTPKEYHAN